MSDLPTTTLVLEAAVTLTTPNVRQVLERVAIGIDVTTEGGVNQIQKSIAASGNLAVGALSVGAIILTDDSSSTHASLNGGTALPINRVMVLMTPLSSLTLTNTDTANTHIVRVVYC